MLKVISVLDEYIDEYRCQCGGRIVCGTQHPFGDYDDWLRKPHCKNCGKESSSNKSPLEEFVLVDARPLKAVFRKSTGSSLGTWPPDATAEHVVKLYSTLTVDQIGFGPVVEPLENETERQHVARVWMKLGEVS